MALNITINKTAVAASYPAGSTVATAVASGGTTPYTYSLGTGGDYFSIDSSTGVVTTKALMDASSIQSFSVTATDSNSTPESITSGVVYPNIQSTQQSKFNKSNVIYKIVDSIDLGNAVLTIPTGCTLDFQGGLFANGTIVGNNTKINAGLQKIFNLDITLNGTWSIVESYPEWFGAEGDGIINDALAIQKCYDYFFNIKLSGKSYFIKSPLTLNEVGSIRGIGNHSVLRIDKPVVIGISSISISDLQFLSASVDT